MSNKVHLQKDEGIAIVTIDNPPLNVLNQEVASELSKVFQQIEVDSEVIVAILTGEGSKAFMAGADIKEFPNWIKNQAIHEPVQRNHHLFHQIESMSKPVIALLNGITLGGGCELALTCDLRIAEEHVQIGLPEITLGIFPGAGGTQRLPRLIGIPRAKELMLTGEPISAKTAAQWGLINQVVPTGKGKETALTWAKKISSYSLNAISAIKKLTNQSVDVSLDKGIQDEATLFEQILQTEDAQEGINAFIEKRKPHFKHR